MMRLIALLLAQYSLSEALSKAFDVFFGIFCPCFLLILLGAIAAFVFLERSRLALMRRWVALSLVLAHVVLYVLISIGFLWLFAETPFARPVGTVGVFSVLVIGCFVLYYLLRRRFAHLDFRRRFVLMPMATVFLGVLEPVSQPVLS